MTLSCRICKYALHSDKADFESAAADIVKKMSDHLKIHPKHAKDFGEALACLFGLAGPYFMFRYFQIADSDEQMREVYEKNKTVLFHILETDPLANPAPMQTAASRELH
jgi:hypothetical protein